MFDEWEAWLARLLDYIDDPGKYHDAMEDPAK